MNAGHKKHASGEMVGEGIILTCKGPGMLVLDSHNSGESVRQKAY